MCENPPQRRRTGSTDFERSTSFRGESLGALLGGREEEREFSILNVQRVIEWPRPIR